MFTSGYIGNWDKMSNRGNRSGRVEQLQQLIGRVAARGSCRSGGFDDGSARRPFSCIPTKRIVKVATLSIYPLKGCGICGGNENGALIRSWARRLSCKGHAGKSGRGPFMSRKPCIRAATGRRSTARSLVRWTIARRHPTLLRTLALDNRGLNLRRLRFPHSATTSATVHLSIDSKGERRAPRFNC